MSSACWAAPRRAPCVWRAPTAVRLQAMLAQATAPCVSSRAAAPSALRNVSRVQVPTRSAVPAARAPRSGRMPMRYPCGRGPPQPPCTRERIREHSRGPPHQCRSTPRVAGSCGGARSVLQPERLRCPLGRRCTRAGRCRFLRTTLSIECECTRPTTAATARRWVSWRGLMERAVRTGGGRATQCGA